MLYFPTYKDVESHIGAMYGYRLDSHSVSPSNRKRGLLHQARGSPKRATDNSGGRSPPVFTIPWFRIRRIRHELLRWRQHLWGFRLSKLMV